jgi:hypothetical protein
MLEAADARMFTSGAGSGAAPASAAAPVRRAGTPRPAKTGDQFGGRRALCVGSWPPPSHPLRMTGPAGNAGR